MAVDLRHTAGDTSLLPSEFLPDDDDVLLSYSQPNNNYNNNRNDKDDDFIAELTHHMDRFLLQDDEKLDLSGIGYNHNSEPSWDLMGSPQSTLWSPLASNNSNQGSSEGSSQEPSPPPTPDSCNWSTTFDVTAGIKLDEERFINSSRSYHTSHDIQSFNSSNINGLCSYQSLIQEQIRAIELSRHKQEQARLLKQKLINANGESEGQISQKSEEGIEEKETNKKGKGGGSVGRRPRPPRPSPMQQQQSGGGAIRAMFLGGSASRAGTGVFLPRSGTTPPPQSTTKKQGKGCSTVLIPARVVQALKQQFDQMASTSGPKTGGFPPLHDVLVSNRDGMYSLQKSQSRKSAANIQNDMNLPQEWTY